VRPDESDGLDKREWSSNETAPDRDRPRDLLQLTTLHDMTGRRTTPANSKT
jgi:hypothetical protein